MPYPQAAYQKLKPEIRFMCRFLAEVNFEDKALFLQVKPDILLDILKQHKLFPPFYKKWVQSAWKNHPGWDELTTKLKKLVDRTIERPDDRTNDKDSKSEFQLSILSFSSRIS